MVIKAKFASICPVCSKGIEVGSNVEWSKGQKATHAGCSKPQKKATKSSTPSLRVDIMEKGFHITGYNITPVMNGNITGFIQKTLINDEAKSFLLEKGYELVKIDSVRFEWCNVDRIKSDAEAGKIKAKRDSKGLIHVYN
ncbi:hypothetical protein [Paenibacillus tianjinensis]|uniref:Uncharacterized protein n=1 Tax=Paenibacillus tianjinensis TaxID=2810347 RepID=A0ABX7L9T9_9BACL|nr:hypothetical protein [Paenibacillus tianjinensis]QSF43498.1 hypothetical protein JRJ22_19745 [Paenibacillus tianjinensis]